MSEKSESVIFLNVQRSYPPGEDLVASYQCQPNSELSPSGRDWVGLFRVGWTSSRDYYTFEWAPQPSGEDRVGQVNFAGRRLPPEDGHFYQLCYVSRDGTVRGVSPPLQFMGTLDDLEMVEVGEEGLTSMVVLQHRSSGELQRLRQDCQRTQEELSSVQASVSELHIAREGLAGQLQESEAARGMLQGGLQEKEARVAELEGVVQEKEARIAELERQVATQRESDKRLMEKLERERAQTQQLLAAKSDGESQTQVLQGQVVSLQEEAAALRQGTEELWQQLQMREAEVQDLQKQLKVQEAQGDDLQRQLKVREDQTEDLQLLARERNEEAERMAAQSEAFAKQLQEERTQVQILQQELSVAQENIAELMGAREELQQAPPPSAGMVERPPSAAGMVDCSVYEALQLAYENMEAYFKRMQQEKEEAHRQLAALQEVNQAMEGKCDELLARIEQGKKEFEAKAAECVVLQRQLQEKTSAKVVEERVVQGGHESSGLQEARVRELEEQVEQMGQNCEAAVRELNSRAEEGRLQQARVVELEAELAQLRLEFTELQDRYDEKVHVKNEALAQQQVVLDEKVSELMACQQEKLAVEEQLQTLTGENTKLEHKVQQLRAQIEQLKASVKPDEDVRSCPVCNTKFPARMHQQDFERHVQGHFQDR